MVATLPPPVLQAPRLTAAPAGTQQRSTATVAGLLEALADEHRGMLAVLRAAESERLAISTRRILSGPPEGAQDDGRRRESERRLELVAETSLCWQRLAEIEHQALGLRAVARRLAALRAAPSALLVYAASPAGSVPANE